MRAIKGATSFSSQENSSNVVFYEPISYHNVPLRPYIIATTSHRVAVPSRPTRGPRFAEVSATMPPSRKKKTRSANNAHPPARSPHEQRRPEAEARWTLLSSVISAALGVVLAYLWATTKLSGGGGTTGSPLSSEDMLAMVRKTDSFDLAGDDGKRTLSATANIPAGTVLMEIPRDLMM